MTEEHFSILHIKFSAMDWLDWTIWILSIVVGSAFEVLKAPEGNFSSAEFPASYPNGVRNMWIINTGDRVQLTFDSFSLQSCADCGCDYVEVRDGPFILTSLIGRYCGNRTEPFTVISSDDYLFVYFKTDSSVSGRGFSAHYTRASKCPSLPRQLEGDVDNCHPKHRHTDKDCGELHEVFNEEQECSWSGKTTASLMRWEFEFLDDFFFKECPDCSCEYIEFFDGRNSLSESLGRFCGSKPPEELVTSGKYVSFTIKAGNSSKVHLKYKAKYSGGMMAAFIGGSIGGLFLFILFLWCCCSVCCKDHEVNSTRNKHEWNKPEIQLHKISTS